MKKILSILVSLSLTVIFVMTMNAQQTVRRQPHPVTVDVTGVNNTNTDGVTRISVNLVSLPNTSSRVDSVTLVTRDGHRYLAGDIDGIDFKRYFQWEDEGKISVDVDFPLQKSTKGARVIFHTVYGDFTGKVNGGKRK
ncbi:MAG: hypothetical protein K2M07_07900 [Muribaculaceae bacterium]|nr:hypothetical protein [Muribaculaceae bacterium]